MFSHIDVMLRDQPVREQGFILGLSGILACAKGASYYVYVYEKGCTSCAPIS